MSGWRGSGPRARATSTACSNAFAAAGGVLARHAASMRTTVSFCWVRRSRSALECFVIPTLSTTGTDSARTSGHQCTGVLGRDPRMEGKMERETRFELATFSLEG
jgi:hypothetical protein